jgi:hypothetical protein
MTLLDVRDVGSLAWLERSGGALSKAERAYLLRGMFGMIRTGFRLRSVAKRSARRRGPLDAFEPPDTPIVAASRALLEASASREMANHSLRTAFWTLVVLDTHTELTPRLVETAWVAALLHDLGFYRRAERGDFSAGGVEALKALAHEHGWSEEQTHEAGEAIAVNLSTRVDPERSGLVAWAMNVGGAGELGIWPHRSQMDRERIRLLESRFPRGAFRKAALADIRDESRRVPDGRFAAFGWVYWLLMRD